MPNISEIRLLLLFLTIVNIKRLQFVLWELTTTHTTLAYLMQLLNLMQWEKEKYLYLLQCLCLDTNRLLELLPVYVRAACVDSSIPTMWWVWTLLSVLHTHTHCKTSFTDNTCTGGYAFFTVFSSLSEYVVFCGYCTRGQLDFDMRRVHACYLSIIHLVGKWLVGHVYCMDYISSEKEQTLNLRGIYRCEADGWKNVVLGLKVSADLSVYSEGCACERVSSR